ncbi:capsular polysaccharide synthesis protein [Larsenimonas salina]|uniref:capsular polysaccharide synthesis protein n=1 Tax=Larsenimonas salina TaxID=1295565 RepID=UPI0020744560|nr:capsular polysaccharide synthesis protein [Larsenimonas salina]MCM5704940.1 capsular polysaccharide synthesis protein [Larsenimonas salina]
MRHLPKTVFTSRWFERKCVRARRALPALDNAYVRFNLPGFTPTADEAAPASKALAALKQAGHAGYREGAAPRILWMYWNTPADEAPEVVRLAIASWQALNPEYEVRVLTDDTMVETLGVDLFSVFTLSRIKLTLAMKTDVLRLYLLSVYGGVWVDATVFCLQPLEKWLPEARAPLDLFTFRHPTERSRPVEAWFIAASPGHPVVKSTLALFVDHLFAPRTAALFVSNNRKDLKKLGVHSNHPERLYADTITAAEGYGFMPYFSVGYFFNESMRRHWHAHEIEAFLALPNRHLSHTKTEGLEQAVVSKETYKKTHQQSEAYAIKKAHLQSLLNTPAR